MLVPTFIGAQDAETRNLSEGWWALTPDGHAVSGPYPTREAAMLGIGKRGEDQPTGRAGEAGPAPE
ncbi:hypothetical protein [Aquabacter spiritensis]|uniref:Uncharacterized protein n=1 Tax=Aquabacter spiritensis TaxID=933073 RepID=A0A4R3M355_9HYPH|nr:hypothetical protein [Aquabacter spiritensis]TCT07654.1 hypothetical protein EDC64_101173 [Aquabacter spiritensis]